MADEVLLQTFPDESLALFWQEVLLDHGIRSMIKPLGPGYGVYGAVGGIFHGLYVLESDIATARALMNDQVDSNESR